ncbi:arsenate reductase/protein-tyrosine-phosphatase family protein [Planctomicrobium piriforme]|uniref:protein-tyrosine-phosphatase n=1 Tax=Planctomicrobium piriforme TaxID=1576369 RepID=A0A1I3F950_9PLAN|nr:Sua5/YciO/YrdC/YwlC family protein [Planctomicrobium piriforme]SFI07757.1 protein-tyrosine phosphatase [Planctomicrobium piriforme]
MPREIFLDQIADTQEAVQAVVAELEAGELVCLPDDCGWNLLGLATHDSSATLLQRSAAQGDATPTQQQSAVSIPHPSVVNDYVTDASKLFSKLSVRCWPGPVVLRGGAAQTEGLARQWPKASQTWGLTERGRAFYCPADSFSQEVLRAVSAPALSLIGQPAERDENIQGREISLIVRSATPRFSSPPTVVAVNGQQFQVERPGVVSERMLERLAGEVYLFVCTGNTCRSPMAEALFRKMLADRLRCREDELMDHGYVVLSAGLAAYKGAAASPEAVDLLRRDNVDLSSHESQPVTEELLFHCDHIFTMTRSHRDALLSAYPELADQVKLLSPQNHDVPDPIGAGMDEYIRCRDSIARHLQRLLDDIDAQDQ